MQPLTDLLEIVFFSFQEGKVLIEVVLQACCSVVFRRCVLQKNFHGGGCYVSKLHLQECQGPRFQSRALLFISNARTKNVANKESGVCRANFLIKTQTLSSMLSKPASSILKNPKQTRKQSREV